MKPTWDKLADSYKDSGGIIIADVDCTSEGGKSVCAAHSIQGYPTIRYFTADTGMAGVDYEHGRSFEAFDRFVKENVALFCDPATKSYCDDEEIAYVEKQVGKEASQLSAEVERLKNLLAGNVKDDGKGKVWLTKRIKILEALIGPSILQRAMKFGNNFVFLAGSYFNRGAMALGDVLEPKLEYAFTMVYSWYEMAKTKILGESKGEL